MKSEQKNMRERWIGKWVRWIGVGGCILGGVSSFGVASTVSPSQSQSSDVAQKVAVKMAEFLSKKAEKDEEKNNPAVTCQDLIQGTLEIPGDGRANTVCEIAMILCLAKKAFSKVVKQGKSPFSLKETKRLYAYVRQESINWRGMCQMARVAASEPNFLTELLAEEKE